MEVITFLSENFVIILTIIGTLAAIVGLISMRRIIGWLQKIFTPNRVLISFMLFALVLFILPSVFGFLVFLKVNRVEESSERVAMLQQITKDRLDSNEESVAEINSKQEELNTSITRLEGSQDNLNDMLESISESQGNYSGSNTSDIIHAAKSLITP